jgi:UDP-N-acetyl-D-glucosamine dehydrogenase
LHNLEKKIQDKSAVIGIIGLGYVGLPLAVYFAEAGFHVLGVEISPSKVDAVNRGESYIGDIPSDRLSRLVKQKTLTATKDQGRLKEADTISMCVPTPLTKTKQPDISYIVYESEQVAKCLHAGQLIVVESTTYPGTTREICLPILEKSKLKVGKDFYLAFSPERIDPGTSKYQFKDVPKIVGGIEPESTKMAALLYQQIVNKVHAVSSAEVAEMTKIFENVFRSVNIALVNETAQLCNTIGISIWEVIAAASTKPYGFMPFYPGPGVGGHCIPLDPYYLADKAKGYDFHTRFIEMAGEINERMPYYVVEQVMKTLNNHGKAVKNAKILVLGAAYKKDIADLRESPSMKLIELLLNAGAKVDYNDPYVPSTDYIKDRVLKSVDLNQKTLAAMDCVIIATDHSKYDYVQIAKWSKLVFDTRGVTRKLKGKNIIRLGE